MRVFIESVREAIGQVVDLIKVGEETPALELRDKSPSLGIGI